jgi:hypothetical protein
MGLERDARAGRVANRSVIPHDGVSGGVEARDGAAVRSNEVR